MYRKDYYPSYNKLLCRTTGYVPTGKGFNLPTERPTLTLLQVGYAEISLTVERWTFALDYVSAVLKDRFLLFLDGPPLESLSSESLCAVSAIPNQE
ncbi:hypothetical protein AYI68_g4045 [Smittium mucronatum]|uniref:Uncharacterized protein n=1 Tax=Smittium mucronatum TaxID=133383 RepID=A0A1R0GYC4_9FUNG|nr:hypothetical protein AYI68_g4045 [Smittium mucronatum]